MHIMIGLGVMVLAALPQTASNDSAPRNAAPSVAVMGLSAKQGVHPDIAEQLSESLVTGFRKTRRFSRVVSSGEIQALISFEQQKQLAACEATSCMAEIAGSLGVDYLVTGTLGRLGKTWLFNVKLINARTAVGEGSVSRPVQGEDEGALLKALDGMVDELLIGTNIPPTSNTTVVASSKPAESSPPPSNVPAAPATVSPAPAASQQPASTSAAASTSPTVSTSETKSSPMPKVLRGLGGVALVGTGAVMLGGLMAAVLAGSSLGAGVLLSQQYVAGMAKLRLPMAVAFYAGVVVAVLGLPLVLLGGVMGAGGLTASFIVE